MTFQINGLHHFAWRCRDAEETRAFYEDILGLPLAHVIRADHVPSTGEYCPYTHIFFQMADGSFIAFFDLGDNVIAEPSANTPSWVNHIALRVGSMDELEAAKNRLQDAGVEVLGITDHHIIQSIYFFDPNGFRVELTTWSVEAAYMDKAKKHARADLDDWTREKQKRLTPA
jgi:catechol 2,3-dioxygenase-like lactoylglutathione lyase family enzyme